LDKGFSATGRQVFYPHSCQPQVPVPTEGGAARPRKAKKMKGGGRKDMEQSFLVVSLNSFSDRRRRL